MYVIKRDGRKERVIFDKVTSRISRLCYGLDMNYVDPAEIAQKVISGIYQGVTTVELDVLAAETAAALTSRHPDYSIMAARLAISNLHKETVKPFSQVVKILYEAKDEKTGKPQPRVSRELYEIVQANAERLNSAIVYDRDYAYSYFGYKTLERNYLFRLQDKIVERPQHMLMRVAVGLHGSDIDSAIETYELMSERLFTHASPTLFNSGTPRPQLSSCFLVTMQDDSIEGIYDTLKQCAQISKCAGGIGLNVHCIRASGSFISGTNGRSNGLVPMLRVFNNTARYVDQGGNKRPGAIAIYLEPWHSDIMDFLDLKKNTGKEENRARDLFYGLWVPDLFMKRVQENGDWSMFSPDESPGLENVWGAAFEELYERYEKEGRAKKVLPAQRVWQAILDAQIETGTPYILYKDACNGKSNHQHLGTIKCSNLCTEVIQFSSPNEIAVCNLASLALPGFVSKECRDFDYKKLHAVTKVITRNLNRVIDINYYPLEQARLSNQAHRPIGIGVQGLADVFLMLRHPFDSEAAREINRKIFETIYYAALEASCELAERDGTYSSYSGSPTSRGILQFDMWNVKPSDLWNWDELRAKISKHGLRNSLLVAPMPTASTSQILGYNECFEPYTSNLYTRRVVSGEFQIVNNHLMRDLAELGLWNQATRNLIIAHGGSIAKIPGIPEDLKLLYRTVWEISQKSLLEMAADRAAFIDQSQSLNVFIAQPTYAKLTSMHFYGWKLGLKTGMYYLRTKPAADAIKFTVDADLIESLKKSSKESQNAVDENIPEMISNIRISNSQEGRKVSRVEEKASLQPLCMLNAGPEGCLSCSA